MFCFACIICFAFAGIYSASNNVSPYSNWPKIVLNCVVVRWLKLFCSLFPYTYHMAHFLKLNKKELLIFFSKSLLLSTLWFGSHNHYKSIIAKMDGITYTPTTVTSGATGGVTFNWIHEMSNEDAWSWKILGFCRKWKGEKACMVDN